MGFISGGDSYSLRGDNALEGLENAEKIVDDILIENEAFKDNFYDVIKVLERCRKHSITLNPKKFVFAQKRVKFAGFILTPGGAEADPDKLRAISEFPKPVNITNLRSFLGIVNQLGAFSSEISTAATPLRALLKKKNEFVWTTEHDRAFEAVKKALVTAPILAPFDPNLETKLETDASRLYGLGFDLLQLHGDDWKLVACGSRFLRDVETRYATLELEAIAIEYAMKKCRIYLCGLPEFTVVTDHRPLIPMFNMYQLSQIENAKVQRIKNDLTSQYQFKLVWKKGKEHCIADGLSRAPVDDPNEDDTDYGDHKATIVAALCATITDDDDKDHRSIIGRLTRRR